MPQSGPGPSGVTSGYQGHLGIRPGCQANGRHSPVPPGLPAARQADPQGQERQEHPGTCLARGHVRVIRHGRAAWRTTVGTSDSGSRAWCRSASEAGVADGLSLQDGPPEARAQLCTGDMMPSSPPSLMRSFPMCRSLPMAIARRRFLQSLAAGASTLACGLMPDPARPKARCHPPRPRPPATRWPCMSCSARPSARLRLTGPLIREMGVDGYLTSQLDGTVPPAPMHLQDLMRSLTHCPATQGEWLPWARSPPGQPEREETQEGGPAEGPGGHGRHGRGAADAGAVQPARAAGSAGDFGSTISTCSAARADAHAGGELRAQKPSVHMCWAGSGTCWGDGPPPGDALLPGQLDVGGQRLRARTPRPRKPADAAPGKANGLNERIYARELMELHPGRGWRLHPARRHRAGPHADRLDLQSSRHQRAGLPFPR